MISALCWVPSGKMSSKPTKHVLSEGELRDLQTMRATQQVSMVQNASAENFTGGEGNVSNNF